MDAAENPRHNMIDCGRRLPAPPAQPARRSTPPALTHWPSTSKKRPADKPQCGPCVPRAALGSVARRAPARVRCIPLTGPRHLSCPSAGCVNPAAARAVGVEGARGRGDGGPPGPRAPGHAGGDARRPSGASGHQSPPQRERREPSSRYRPRSAISTPRPLPHRPTAGRGRPRLPADSSWPTAKPKVRINIHDLATS